MPIGYVPGSPRRDGNGARLDGFKGGDNSDEDDDVGECCGDCEGGMGHGGGESGFLVRPFRFGKELAASTTITVRTAMNFSISMLEGLCWRV